MEQALDLEAPRLHPDEDALPGAVRASRVPYLNHGRRIVRNRSGICICAYVFDRGFPDRNWLGLSIGRDAESEGGDFHETLMLLGRCDVAVQPLFDCADGTPNEVCLLLDGQDRLQVVYEQDDGIFVMSADAGGAEPHAKLARAESWSAALPAAGSGWRLGDALLTPAGERLIYAVRAGTLYELAKDGEPVAIAEQAERPSVWMDEAGFRHLAFERARRIYYLRSPDGRRWENNSGGREPELVAHYCSSFPSLTVAADGAPVVAYQGEGKEDLRREPPLYDRLRPGGGSTVSYAVYRDGAWRIHDLVRSSEILLRRRPCSSLGGRDGYFQARMEEFWRPSLVVDRHGVIWMFYLNTTRRHVYFSRFLGETCGDRFEACGAYNGLSRLLFVGRDARRQDCVDFLAVADERFHFTTLPVPDYNSLSTRRVVFLDNLEVAEVVGLEHGLGLWRKEPRPVFGPDGAGADADDHVAWCRVLPGAQGGFEMHYMGQGRGGLFCSSMPGRAFSADGVHWEKRPAANEEDMTLDGVPLGRRFWRPLYLEDPEERDSRRRFKGLLAKYARRGAIEVRRWNVVASPDARHWHTVGDLPPVVQGDISVPFHLIRDDEDRNPARRYKVSMLLGAAAGRAVCVFTSPDLLHWNHVVNLREDPDDACSSISPFQTGPIALDPDAGESPWEEEIHDAVLWRENGLLMMHYDAFYFGANQHVNKALAVSRDGRHYYRVKQGAVNLPHGHCGEWDSGRVRSSPPVAVGDELRMYFAGMPAGFFGDPDGAESASDSASVAAPSKLDLRPWRVGLARLRKDGWAYFQLRRERSSGYLTTIPFEYRGGRLVVNGGGPAPDCLAVEVRAADNRSAIPGFESRHCRFVPADGVAVDVRWHAGKTLPHGVYRLRFVFNDLRVKLYAFGFVPDV